MAISSLRVNTFGAYTTKNSVAITILCKCSNKFEHRISSVGFRCLRNICQIYVFKYDVLHKNWIASLFFICLTFQHNFTIYSFGSIYVIDLLPTQNTLWAYRQLQITASDLKWWWTLDKKNNNNKKINEQLVGFWWKITEKSDIQRAIDAHNFWAALLKHGS